MILSHSLRVPSLPLCATSFFGIFLKSFCPATRPGHQQLRRNYVNLNNTPKLDSNTMQWDLLPKLLEKSARGTPVVWDALRMGGKRPGEL